ncbi:zinc finger BED domain-containing protein 4-like [Mastacembelus armatus]|uniref:zinc finger BED domain-containing protein 4-like n=1 Tax=Mastacembelus armatus TaxID=205130 RepID=UPI000E462C8E|nr:zinc finger BED domain-containing protein 4-like [Mastacembelus armatus]
MLTRECASLIDRSAEDVALETATTSAGTGEENYNLWALQDNYVESQHCTSSASASAAVEIQRYLKEQILTRAEDPLKYWVARKTLYPMLWKLACKYLCIPASSVPCERIFSKAGELVSQKRSRLKPVTVVSQEGPSWSILGCSPEGAIQANTVSGPEETTQADVACSPKSIIQTDSSWFDLVKHSSY